MTLQRLMALQDTLDDIGWIIIEPASNPFRRVITRTRYDAIADTVFNYISVWGDT